MTSQTSNFGLNSRRVPVVQTYGWAEVHTSNCVLDIVSKSRRPIEVQDSTTVQN